MDPHEVLGVARDADLDEIRRAYLAAARTSHPDFHADDEASREAAETRMREINLAWEELRDPAKPGGGGRTGTKPTGRSGPAPSASEGRRWRPYDPSPDPGFDESHDRPITGGGIPGWLRLAPPGGFAAGLLVIVLGALTGLLPVVAIGFFCLLVSVILFVVAPLVALTSSHRGSRPRESR